MLCLNLGCPEAILQKAHIKWSVCESCAKLFDVNVRGDYTMSNVIDVSARAAHGALVLAHW